MFIIKHNAATLNKSEKIFTNIYLPVRCSFYNPIILFDKRLDQHQKCNTTDKIINSLFIKLRKFSAKTFSINSAPFYNEKKYYHYFINRNILLSLNNLVKKQNYTIMGKSSEDLQREFDQLVKQVKKVAGDLRDPALQNEIYDRLSQILADSKSGLEVRVEQLKSIATEAVAKVAKIDQKQIQAAADSSKAAIDPKKIQATADNIKGEIEKLAKSAEDLLNKATDPKVKAEITKEVEKTLKENTDAAAGRLKALLEQAKKNIPKIDEEQIQKAADDVIGEIQKLAKTAEDLLRKANDPKIREEISKEVEKTLKENTDAAAERLKKLLDETKKKIS